MNATSECFLAPLTEEALLQINGPDAAKFLQGQVTCDTRKLADQEALYGAYCTPHGRVVCDFLLCQRAPDHLLLRQRRSILETSAATFGKYIVFSRADLETSQTDWQLFGCWGDAAETTLNQVFSVLPARQMRVVSGDGFVLVALPEKHFECYLHGEAGASFAQQLQSQSTPATETAWQSLEIHAGIARIEAQTTEMFIPQMLNYDLTGHVSFDKGCYTGQEVVARLHYRGTPKRRLYLAEATLPEAPLPGCSLHNPASPQAVGNVVNSVTEASASILLVSAAVASADQGLHLGTADGPALQLGTHPHMAVTE